jgi:DNA-binding NtrC family response regulator
MPQELIGQSSAFRRLRKEISRLARTRDSIVLLGEMGVGKSLFAEHIHAAGESGGKSLQIINCRTISERDMKLAFFGGGPPDLYATRKSLLEVPTTTLVKNVDTAPAYIQNDLADILLQKHLKRPGEEKNRPVRSRLIFTLGETPLKFFSTGSLTRDMHAFLSDLRVIRIPPLRKRRGDLPEFLQNFMHDSPPEKVLSVTERYDWPGNVTELKSYLRTLSVVSPEEALREHEKREVERMLLQIEQGREFSLSESLELIELGMIRRAYARNGAHQAKTARLLGLSDRDIRRKLEKII